MAKVDLNGDGKRSSSQLDLLRSYVKKVEWYNAIANYQLYGNSLCVIC
ncbi:hypothetical protein [Sulfuracidifex tepidarius]|uniref:Uncharacterized protein n=1 Tax=Sulfuracidifex tepidarius TaxID=1294262 RepID=A0A510DS92_9CREN|nr:hypothetical protein [Sulfuracidifex tepidarius]BBG23051.1 hypothetical protein IC006_0335 [Sulfuracidifex tepidarius]BBG25814.1 hypothetical protein IC007_0319 [Sulfuracidifex tepidarius]